MVGSRTYVNQGGVWIDTAIDPTKVTPVKLVFLSNEYFAFLATHPGLAKVLALGDHLMVLADGTVYEIVPA